MNILPKVLAASLAVGLNLPKPVSAVPILVAPIVCAKVCVLLGTAVVGGVTSYVWQHRQDKKKYFADELGNVRKIETLNPVFHKYVTSPEKCNEMARKYGWRIADLPKYVGNGALKYRCTFFGKDQAFPGAVNE